MKILILGGTRFLGRFLTENARKRGHEVTLFNRGKENPDLFPDVEKLMGDRNGDLKNLEGRKWDAVIDTCGFVPRTVRESAELLSKEIGHYTFISSGSVYNNLEEKGIDENHSINKLSMEKAEEMTEGTAGPIYNEYYGHLKALCEQELERIMPSRNLVVRAGLIVGPFDYSDRFSYWVNRVAKGGEVLAPGRKDKEIQFIDVRDLAEWIIKMVETNVIGVFNATGPHFTLTMERFLEECKKLTNSNTTYTWVSEDFLLDKDIKPWTELPLWLPDKWNMSGFLSMNIEKAEKRGLTCRPLKETIRDTLTWESTRTNYERKAGMDINKERKILKWWNQYPVS
ncbi:2'-hydroxyisoflavone reductase [Salirhabdus euzebyi]|uniref:2'-hydroxyisoflavone reductase n=1 Tax=Salirhabdus euzebyi TaxID=394506 RepID=A0A841PYY5_9BACI|nr:SDR family oxidoreductase [Salirhabdus euzebyi]MBB6452381.1 2'-hydroxyisoflavone reductase [Salirhabdus euzebyi]